jgi:hypothetical protein
MLSARFNRLGAMEDLEAAMGLQRALSAAFATNASTSTYSEA